MSNYLYIVWSPPTSESLSVGVGPYGTTTVLNFYPAWELSPGSTVTKVPVTAPAIPIAPTGTNIPPPSSTTSPHAWGGFVKLDVEEGDVGEGDVEDADAWQAPTPDTGGEEWEFELEVATDEFAEPNIIPLRFAGGSVNISGIIGNAYVYFIAGNSLSRLDSRTGVLLKTWDLGEYLSGVYTNNLSNVVILATGSELKYLDGNSDLVSFFTFTGDAIFGGFNGAGYFWWFVNGMIYLFNTSTFSLISSITLNNWDGTSGYGCADSSGNYYFSEAENYNLPSGETGSGTYFNAREYAKISKYNSGGTRLWSKTFDDWNYGDEYESRERLHITQTDSADNIYLLTKANYKAATQSYEYRRIIKLSSTGEWLWEFSQPIAAVEGFLQTFLAVADSGYSVFVFNLGELVAMSPEGIVLWQNNNFGNLEGLQIGKDGFIYVKDANGVYKLDVSGELVWATSGTGGGPTNYTVTYNGNTHESGTVPTDSSLYTIGDSVTVLANTGSLIKTDYTFAGWNTASDGSGIIYFGGDSFVITADTTLYALWEAETVSYTAKSVIFDIADNWGGWGIAVRQIDFWYGGSKIPNVYANGDFVAYATSYYNPDGDDAFAPRLSFDTTTAKTGWGIDTNWMATSANQRLICVFDSPITFDEIRVNNAHSVGTDTNGGAKNVVINSSTDEITNTTYNAAITNATEIFAGQFDQHIASDVEDEQNLMSTSEGGGE